MEKPSSSAAGPAAMSAGIVPTLYEISVEGRAQTAVGSSEGLPPA